MIKELNDYKITTEDYACAFQNQSDRVLKNMNACINALVLESADISTII